jgi:FlaA1/EpsC-like NDP-sugar epimerase
LGFLDDDSSKIGGHIQGIPILGNLDTLSKWIDTFAVEQVIFTMSNPDGKIISKVRTVCDEHKVTFKILPALSELLDLNFNIKSLREVQVEDLLGRPVVDLDLVSIQSYLRGKKILITGSGGSIGSELARQVLHFKPSTIILLDSAETPLYEIDYELRNHYGELDVNFLPVICDIKNLSRLSQVFEQHSPDVVFHSAAYKHVPMMEIQPQEAVLNNVMGTKNLVDVSRLSGVERFVLISTDKAVNPVNIMGATKRAAELYIQFVSANSKTKFITVRFGNVLGSNGSVIPRFKEQIKKGGPVTVTHPDVIRFFMTIQEASQLVLQAGSMGEHGEIFILEMGEPVKILSLAEEMIRLSGFTPYKDINIEFSGLRPGEKLFEELLLDKEGTIATHHPKIRIATNLEEPNPLILQNKLNNLFTAAKANKAEEIFFLLKDLIPEYQIHKEYVSQNKISIRPNG